LDERESLMSHHVTEVFTPTTTARVTFVERRKINARLVNALRTPGMQVVVYGRSGCGKTTLLVNKLSQVYEREVISRCTLDTTIEDLLLDAFDRLDPFYTSAVSNKRTTTVSAGVEATFQLIKSAFSRETSTEEGATSARALPPQLTPTFLARLLGEVDACWVLEDFHKVAEAEKSRLSQLMKLFMDMATEYPRVKIIAIGAVSSARQIVQYDREMWNRVAEIEVPLMTGAELNEIMKKGADALNLELDDDVLKGVMRSSNGLPAVCHQLCLNLCFNAGIEVTATERMYFGQDDLNEAMEQWLEDSADTLQDEYDRATRAKRIRKFDNCRLIVHSLAELGPDGATHPELLARISLGHPDYPAGNLTKYLRQLCSEERGFLFSRDKASGRFRFASPMMHAYARGVAGRQPVPEEDEWLQHEPKLKLSEFFKLLLEVEPVTLKVSE